MVDVISTILKSFEKLTPIFLVVAVCTGVLLCSPASVKEPFGLDILPKAVEPWVGLTFLVSAASFLVNVATFCFRSFGRWCSKRKGRNLRVQVLKSLTPEEKATLIPFVWGGMAAWTIEMQDGIASLMERKRILTPASSMVWGGRISWGVQPWAIEELNQEAGLLDGYCERRLQYVIGKGTDSLERELAEEEGVRSLRLLASGRRLQNRREGQQSAR